jgi:hypothetical protein
MGVTEESIRAWLANPDGMPDEKRLALADLVDEMTDPRRKK